MRLSVGVAPSKKTTVYVVSDSDTVRKIFEDGRVFFTSLGSAAEVIVQADKTGIHADAVSAVTSRAVVYIPFEELVDKDKELARLKKEEKRLEGELARSRGMLGNEKFVSRAPQTKIDEERAKLAKYEEMMAKVKEQLAHLGA